MELNIKPPQFKTHVLFVRLDDDIFNQIMELAEKYNAKRSTVARELIIKALKEN